MQGSVEYGEDRVLSKRSGYLYIYPDVGSEPCRGVRRSSEGGVRCLGILDEKPSKTVFHPFTQINQFLRFHHIKCHFGEVRSTLLSSDFRQRSLAESCTFNEILHLTPAEFMDAREHGMAEEIGETLGQTTALAVAITLGACMQLS